jgi:hypothetical protein
VGSHKLEPYVRKVKNLDERKFRISNDKIEIEVGREKRKTVDE